MSDTPRTDAHTRQLIDTLQHPHWIEFARTLERETVSLQDDLDALQDTLRGMEVQQDRLKRENAELRLDGICRRRGIPTREESKRIKELDEHIERLWKENAALRADKERLTELLRRWKEFIDEAVVAEDRSNLDGDNAETVLFQINDGAEEMLALLTPEELAAIDAARKERFS